MHFIQKTIIRKIEEYKNISIFFHEIPDFDGLGGAFALQDFIRNKFPDKQVKVIGLEILDPVFWKGYFEFSNEHVLNNFIKNSLGIIVDTANEKRVWTLRHTFCKELIRIDHHPQIESFAQIEWIDPDASATCEMLGEFLYEWDEKYISPIVASYLYAGIITDTARFLYPKTRSRTFAVASKLIATNFDRERLNDILYQVSYTQYKFNYYVLNLLKYFKRYRFGYAIIPKNAFKKYNIKLRNSMVHIFNNIRELDVWMSIYYDDTINKWRGSLRSKKIPINVIASKYNGGGHDLAAAFTLKKYSDYKKIVKSLKKYIKDIIEG